MGTLFVASLVVFGALSAAKAIGLSFKLDVVPATGCSNYLYDPATRGNTDLLSTQFWPNIPNPLDWIALTAITGAPAAFDCVFYPWAAYLAGTGS